jgi:hypothetical protein
VPGDVEAVRLGTEEVVSLKSCSTLTMSRRSCTLSSSTRGWGVSLLRESLPGGVGVPALSQGQRTEEPSSVSQFLVV